ncbi:hypothetical protein SD427_12625 [Chryseobacterium sp. JJR-5R]|uniref:hypothetical protein n=1 Tax=Chryseobacterium sp. JJR-5R TaxID=3093923 RepID=UPI002A75D4B0|nr:hypothetical protein [Chryseobacterium sp. JJR-5R]WPO81608.1 hypothetical protein SD427_12625 [Chryseobacterium sp. JJR-5R]
MFTYYANGGQGDRASILTFLGLNDQLSPIIADMGGGGGGISAGIPFGRTAAYKALMSGKTSSITNVNGYLNWNTLDNANANGMLDDGSMGGMTSHSLKVGNSNDTPWDAYKNWADYGSGTIGTMYKTIADQRTTLYNSGYWVDNLGRRRLVNTFASPLRGSSANYLRTTTMFGKYAKRAGYIGYGLSAVEIGQCLYEDKGRFGKNTAVATAKVTTGIVVSGAVGAGATWLTGALAGAAGGSVAPGVGTVIGFVVGGVAGYFASDYVGGLVENSYK